MVDHKVRKVAKALQNAWSKKGWSWNSMARAAIKAGREPTREKQNE